MKILNNYLNINSSKNFQRKVLKFFPNAKNVSLDGLRLFEFAGYGQYKHFLSLTIDEEHLLFSLYHTNSIERDYYDSEAFDNLSKRSKDNYLKNCVLSILKANII